MAQWSRREGSRGSADEGLGPGLALLRSVCWGAPWWGAYTDAHWEGLEWTAWQVPPHVALRGSHWQVEYSCEDLAGVGSDARMFMPGAVSY